METYVSIDVEADGPIPGPYSMLSLGAAAFSPSLSLISTFSINLQTLEGAGQHPDTMDFWSLHPKAYEAARQSTASPEQGMLSFEGWVKQLPGKPVPCAYPAGFDWTFVYWYLQKFLGRSPFLFSCRDRKSYAMALMRTTYRGTSKKRMPKRWFPLEHKHTHVAVEDAIEQGHIFMTMLQENRKRRGATLISVDPAWEIEGETAADRDGELVLYNKEGKADRDLSLGFAETGDCIIQLRRRP